jgi:hypothetical protein
MLSVLSVLKLQIYIWIFGRVVEVVIYQSPKTSISIHLIHFPHLGSNFVLSIPIQKSGFGYTPTLKSQTTQPGSKLPHVAGGYPLR